MFYDLVFRREALGTTEGFVVGSGKWEDDKVAEAIKVLRKDVWFVLQIVTADFIWLLKTNSASQIFMLLVRSQTKPYKVRKRFLRKISNSMYKLHEYKAVLRFELNSLINKFVN